jgi:2,4-diketo-3-deoxy-L-fuconate hydrolase
VVSGGVLLFVYGSLKRGFRHHRELCGASFQSPARTLPRYRLVSAGEYPVLLPGGDTRVAGELYEVPRETLARLDEFEGPAYARKVVELEGGLRALAYVGDPRAFADHPSISDGVWRKIGGASGRAFFRRWTEACCAAMKLVRFGEPGREKPGVLLESGRRKDCSAFERDFDHEFFASGGLERLRELLAERGAELPDVAEGERWGACVARPYKVVCVGLNYRDHAAESGLAVPSEPVLFMKATNTVVGPYDDVLIPRGSTKTDWEVELGVIIGKNARYLASPEAAKDHIAGYCISHDVSEREFQLERSGQWTKGKSCDTFNPIGPFLATADEIPDVSTLDLTLSVNGERRQTGNTKTMVFDVFYLVHYISQFMTLEAGDLISTGTPPGVGLGLKPPRYLAPGDVVELSVTGLGTQRQVFKSA